MKKITKYIKLGTLATIGFVIGMVSRKEDESLSELFMVDEAKADLYVAPPACDPYTGAGCGYSGGYSCCGPCCPSGGSCESAASSDY